MKITQVKATPLKNHAVFVRVWAENGLYGLGECYPNRADYAARLLADFVNHGLGPRLIGEDARRIDAIWHKLYFATTARQGDKGPWLAGIAGVDIALWDLLGKTLSLPVCDLLGGRFRDKIPMYASIGGGDAMTPDEMLKAVAPFAEQGFRAFKIRMHWGSHRVDEDPAKDLALFCAVRAFLGDGVPLAFDANNGYSVAMAIRQGRRLEELDLAHYEEPVAHYDYDGLARVADALDAPVSAGEQEYTRWQFRDLIVRGRVDIVQPDVLKCGGITEMRRIMHLADAHNRAFVPHQNQATVGLAANLHVLATVPFGLRPQEFLGRQPELDALFREPLQWEDGCFRVPAKPGLGLELDEDALEAFAL
jgi:D-arabinonate dehydratase/D-galactarolactone cycloisomerase